MSHEGISYESWASAMSDETLIIPCYKEKKNCYISIIKVSFGLKHRPQPIAIERFSLGFIVIGLAFQDFCRRPLGETCLDLRSSEPQQQIALRCWISHRRPLALTCLTQTCPKQFPLPASLSQPPGKKMSRDHTQVSSMFIERRTPKQQHKY